MPDSANTNTGATNPAVTPQESAPAEPAPVTGDVKLEDLPESWQKEIKRLRTESGGYRTKASTLETQLTDERTAWTNKEADYTGKVSSASNELARFRAAALSGVSADRIDDFASRLRGSTPEELQEDAARLAEMFAVSNGGANANRGVDPSQGRGNSSSTPSSPGESFANFLRAQVEGH